MSFILVLLLAALSLLAISLKRTYYAVPAKELKRRARHGDELAAALYKAASYGHSLHVILWCLVVLTSALFFVFVARLEPWWFALAASVALLYLGFVWLPASRVSSVGQWLAARLAPVFSWLLQYIHPLINKIAGFIRQHRPLHFHSGLYEKADVLDLLENQEVQADNRIDQTELEIVRNALLFGDRLVRDVMTPRRVVRAVSVDDDLGPVLMTELHDSGYSRFPVHDGKADNIVGTLFLRDLVKARAGGKVRSKMQPTVFYLHEDQSLHDALRAILKTHHHLYIVVNTFEEYVGIITIEDVLEKILGEPIIDEFDQYDDMRAVAKRAAKQDHAAHADEAEATSLDREED